jgi:hypothetical protein
VMLGFSFCRTSSSLPKWGTPTCYYLCQRLRSKSSAVRATAAMPLLIVLGFDDQQKPRGARFVDAKPDLVTSCGNL